MGQSSDRGLPTVVVAAALAVALGSADGYVRDPSRASLLTITSPTTAAPEQTQTVPVFRALAQSPEMPLEAGGPRRPITRHIPAEHIVALPFVGALRAGLSRAHAVRLAFLDFAPGLAAARTGILSSHSPTAPPYRI